MLYTCDLPTCEQEAQIVKANLAAIGLRVQVNALPLSTLFTELVRAAPWIAYGNGSYHELFSARMGCETYGVYGLDLTALCVRRQR